MQGMLEKDQVLREKVTGSVWIHDEFEVVFKQPTEDAYVIVIYMDLEPRREI